MVISSLFSCEGAAWQNAYNAFAMLIVEFKKTENNYELAGWVLVQSRSIRLIRQCSISR